MNVSADTKCNLLLATQRFRFFKPTFVLLPISVASRNVSYNGNVIYKWRELRIFGVMLAMWGGIG